MNSWTVFFMFKPYTTIHTTILVSNETIEQSEAIKLAALKIKEEMNIDVYEFAEKLGKNDNFGDGWIAVEENGEATDVELEVIK